MGEAGLMDKEFSRPPVPTGKTALIHDWLTGMRGGEMVLEELCRLFPDADLYTLVHIKGSVSAQIEKHRIIESPIARTPIGRNRFRALLPLFPWAIESFDLRGYDLVISTSHCVAKGVIPPPDAVNISYIHTPMRYVWDIRRDYIGPDRMKRPTRFIAGWIAHYLRNWDVTSSCRVDRFAANSQHVRKRILKYYRRESEVINPPVNVNRFVVAGKSGGDYFLTVSALAPYKRIDLAVQACTKLGVRLVVVGSGSEQKRLERLAGSKVEFVGSQTEEQLSQLYGDVIALIHPAEEDFGIVPVEAQACGKPVIAYGRGGVCETVIGSGDNPTGEFFDEQSVEALEGVLRNFDPGRYKPEVARANAERFSRDIFIERICRLIRDTWENSRNGRNEGA